MGTFWILVSLIIFVCILLVLVVMVQNPKGGGLSSTFGGGQQQIGGVKSTTDFLDRSTWVLAAIILILILISIHLFLIQIIDKSFHLNYYHHFLLYSLNY